MNNQTTNEMEESGDFNFAQEFNSHRSNIRRFENEFRRIFDLRLKDYYGSNALEIAAFGFDVVKFSDDISKRNCQQEWSEVDSPFSLMEIILLEYKQEGVDLIESLTR